MQSPIVVFFAVAMTLCALVASCTLITEVDRGLIGEGGASSGGADGSGGAAGMGGAP